MFSGLIKFFVTHRTAANILMILMLLIGVLSTTRINKQFFPDISIDAIGITVAWSGATAEDVDSNIVQSLEPELRSIDGVKSVKSTSFEGRATAVLEFDFGTDMQKALSDVENAIGAVDFPDESETPVIIQAAFASGVSTLTLYGDVSLDVLRFHSKQIKEELLRVGVDKINIIGLPEEEIIIEVRESELARLGLNLTDLSQVISASSIDIPAGSFADGALRVRSLGKKYKAADFANIEVLARSDGSSVLLGDVANLRDDVKDSSVLIFHDSLPAVNLSVQRSKTNDSLEINKVVQTYLASKTKTLPASLTLAQHGVQADLISERIDLMVTNGISGLIIVLLVLFLFLPARIAFWVAWGIPVAFMATFGVMLLSGQTINMISLFGLIMALGIVVDDAIVVGEHTEYLRTSRSLSAQDAAILAATRMGGPVFSSTLTTIAAFIPLFIIQGVIGAVIVAIPAVVCAVLVVSLIECFLILPTHLAHGGGDPTKQPSRFRRTFDSGFDYFKERFFSPVVRISFRFRYVTFAAAFGLLILSIGMMAGGRVGFVFFSSPEADITYVNFTMVPGSSENQTMSMLSEIERAVTATEEKLTSGDNDIIDFTYSQFAKIVSEDDTDTSDNVRQGSVFVNLVSADKRDVRSRNFVESLRIEISPQPGLDSLQVRAPEGGPPGRDVDIRIMGDDLDKLKMLALKTTDIVKKLPGVTDVVDNMDYGAEERIVSLTPLGRTLGFTTQSIGLQIRSALDGAIVQKFARGDEEVTVRLSRPDSELLYDDIGQFQLIDNAGNYVALDEVAKIDSRLGFDIVRRQDGFREIAILGDLDEAVLNTSQFVEAMEKSEVPKLISDAGYSYRYGGRNQEQDETFADMQVGAVLALVSIYVILAWVFSSWSLPLSVMVIIPFCLIGAVFGHYIMGLSLNILSMFAIIALAGIVVNNSIILVVTIERRKLELENDEYLLENAVVRGAMDRLRPMLLTSLTTIGGLSALMFETSMQAQFLIPMATTITFGLAVTSVLVLFVVPAMIGVTNDFGRLIRSALLFFGYKTSSQIDASLARKD
ncbi:efflux RND transporter permease subunit [Alphaproteobacteria bacterium]|jgi:multidrug efflux pump subunit AcrB|nr:efflux RND transporter permease subunit [Alphaproteobacteria bacterium]MDC0394587.1 efflux RND transporter permease subunit [Alphaproteobacteria bacterium]